MQRNSHPLFRKGDNRMCMQMTCIHAKASQNLQPMNPVALGLGLPDSFAFGGGGGMMMAVPDPNNPQAMAQLAEQQRQQYIQFWNMMAMGQQQLQNQGNLQRQEVGITPEHSTTTGASESSNNIADPVMAFQEPQQFYSMMMAQQAMAAGMNPQMMQWTTGLTQQQQQLQQQQNTQSGGSAQQQQPSQVNLGGREQQSLSEGAGG